MKETKMKIYEVVEVFLPIEFNEEQLKDMSLDYKEFLKENNFEDNLDNFDEYYYDDCSNEYFYNFLFKHNLDFDIKGYNYINDIYLAIKKYM